MTPTQELPAGTVAVSRELLDGQLRITRREVLGTRKPNHPRYVGTNILSLVQHRGPTEADEIKYQWEGRSGPQWTDGLYPVERDWRRP